MNNLSMRKANLQDCSTYFQWMNDPLVRSQSYNSSIVDYADHEKWFTDRINDPDYYFFIFSNENSETIGQVRITKLESNTSIIGVSVDSKYRGKAYAPQILKLASKAFLEVNPFYSIHAHIKAQNIASINSFIIADFFFEKELLYNNESSVLYIKKQDNENR